MAAWEFKGVGQAAGAAQGAARVRGSASDAAELQVGRLRLRLSWLKPEHQSPRLDHDEVTVRLESENLASGGPTARPAGRLHGGPRLARHVVPRDARRRQRGTDQEGRGRDRVRLRLPRRHLRHVQPGRQRRRARSRSRHDRLPAPHAPLQGRRTITSSPGARRRSRSSRIWSSIAARSIAIIAAGGFVSVNCGGAPDGNTIPIPKDIVRDGDGLGRLHRLRRVRRRLQERVGAPLHEREDLAPGAAAAGAGRARRSASSR